MTGSSHFEDLQGRLRGVLFAVADQLPSITVGLVGEMVDANECGVALEIMSEMLVESGASLDPGLIEDVGQLVERMSMDVVNVDRLRPLIAESRCCDGDE